VAKNDVDLRSVDLADGKLVYDPDMKMGTLRKLMAAGTEGNLDGMIEAYTSIVHGWPHEGDPKDIEAWDDLRRSEFAALNEAMMEDLKALGEA